MTQQRKYKVGEQVETKLRGWSFGKSQNKGTKYVRVVFDGYISRDLWVTPDAMEQTMKTLEILGFKGAHLGMLRDCPLDTEKTFMVTIDEVQEYNGKTYYKCSWINDPDKLFGGFDEKSKDLYDEFCDIDTRAYIADAVSDQGPMTSAAFNGDSGFTVDDVPF